MVDFNDPVLVFEHKLRNYVRQVRETLDAVVIGAGNSYPSITIEYEANDGGRWRICTYHNRSLTEMRGASLQATADVWTRTFIAQHNIAVLPALIACSTNDTGEV